MAMLSKVQMLAQMQWHWVISMEMDSWTWLSEIDMPGGDLSTKAIALADMDNDGHIDVIIGNYEQPEQLLMNKGNGQRPDNLTWRCWL
jgi:hypothetical protein